jgi:sugar lactone lactonase YvrE
LAAACTASEGSGADDPLPTTSTASTAGAIEAPAIVEQSYAGTVAAPEFPDGLDWINTEQPVRLGELTGKIVLLDFWTYGCINCIHVIPDLKRLEEEYPNELVVIGVHSAKFANEGETANIRQVVMRYEVDHPVVNDGAFQVWQTWGAQAWPTVALIDPAGNVVGMQAGEGVYETVQPIIEGLIREFEEQLDRTPYVLTPERTNAANTLLSYPGKVTVGDGVLYVSDTGHHRILAADPTTGEITAVYGNGSPGFESGSALTAQFDSPQGLAFDSASQTLYVADTNNHAIRSIDIATGEVTTLAGTGTLGWPPASALFIDARLNSPWGLTLQDGDLWVAMAGFHQIWVADLDGGVISPAVGSGLEGVANGDLGDAALAQPSGLVFDDKDRLYFTDSESSSIRWADAVALNGQTGVLSGSDVNLFDFGDIDAAGTAARLQHPLGIVWDGATGQVLIADTYNSKLKMIDPGTGETTTYLGGEQGWADGSDPRFYEPGGLALDGRDLYVADTNNHVIRVVDLETDQVSTLVLHGIERFTPPPDDAAYAGTVIELAPVEVAAGPGAIRLAIELPDGYKVNEQAPSSVSVTVSGGVASLPDGNEQSLTGATLPIDLGAQFASGSGTITADVTLLYCRDDSEGLCIIEQVRFNQPLTVSDGGAGEVVLPHRVQLPNF